ncbi:PREDICTED: uncharacterized protein LOC109340748 [Lupinus angustifolius]|uniref:uncharacterized protein LOC109340748 n=1 Tax=Lupinus angustifolius TaxID=3871 RepID=UPI00092E7DC4|nr:PREDICTED: uncharacterized protein LOC109340748 [Lupinus angustifolius]
MQHIVRNLCSSLWGGDNFDWAFKSSIGNSGGILSIWNKDTFLAEDISSGTNFVLVKGKWALQHEFSHIMNVYCPCDLDGKHNFWDEAKSAFWAMMAMSMIDIFLVNDGWLTKWGALVQFPRIFSDHCPILLKNDVSYWGPTPFRTNKYWLSDHRFGQLVTDEWNKLDFSGRGSFVFKEKLKKLKVVLKCWNKEKFGMLDRQIEDKVVAINLIDAKCSTCSLSENDVQAGQSNTAELWRLSRQKNNLLWQKSRQKWIREGLDIDGEWIDDPIAVKSHISTFFEDKFDENYQSRPSLDGIDFNCLSDENNVFLTAKFEVEEIKEAIWSCDGDKSLGPDGYNFTFFKKFWDCLKKKSPQGLNDFRPISLIGSIQKIISKLLAARIKKVIHLVISDCQSAFIKGRFIMDGVVVANEVIDQVKKKRRGDCFILKVDFEKAYDSVNWEFLIYMMERLGFCLKWRLWIKNLLQVNSVSILVNGSATKEFFMAKGLRQGDPLAPFLFLIVAEGLSGIIRMAVTKNIYFGYKVGRDAVSISHLQYADDTLLIGENSEHNIMAMDKLYCVVGSIPFNFLGIPVGVVEINNIIPESVEFQNFEELLRQLHGIVPKQHSDDSWNWIHDTNGKYSVRNAYQTLQKVDGSCGLAFFKRLWACNAPAKMKCLV